MAIISQSWCWALIDSGGDCDKLTSTQFIWTIHLLHSSHLWLGGGGGLWVSGVMASFSKEARNLDFDMNSWIVALSQ